MTLGPNDLVISAPPLTHVPLLERLAPVCDAGFKGMSLMPGDVWDLERQGMSAADIALRMADHGLAICELDCTGWWLPAHRRLDPTDEMGKLLRSLSPERVIDTAARIGAPSMTAVEMCNVEVDFDEAVEAFAGICDYAAERGVKVHLEFLPFGGIPDLMSAWRIVEAAGRPNGGLTLDSWHLFRSGSTLEQLAAIPGERIFTAQINDAPAQPEADLMHETMNGRLLPGQGSFDLTGFIRTLDAIGSTAPVAVEVFSADLPNQPLAEVARSWAAAGAATLAKARNPQ